MLFLVVAIILLEIIDFSKNSNEYDLNFFTTMEGQRRDKDNMIFLLFNAQQNQFLKVLYRNRAQWYFASMVQHWFLE